MCDSVCGNLNKPGHEPRPVNFQTITDYGHEAGPDHPGDDTAGNQRVQ